MRKIGIFGLPNGGKSQFRRFLLETLRNSLGNSNAVRHYDADEYPIPRCPQDADCRAPRPEDEGDVQVFIIEDVRGTMPHVPGDRKNSSWQPVGYYDFVFYLRPDWPTYSLFWTSRALQWYKKREGDHRRESGSVEIHDEDAVIEKVSKYLLGREQWESEDIDFLSAAKTPFVSIKPKWIAEGKIEWGGWDGLATFYSMEMFGFEISIP